MMQMSKRQKFEDALNHVCSVVKTDGNWKYANAGKGTLEAERKNKRAFNCAHGVNYALKIAGIIPEKGLFYIDGKATLRFQGTAEQKKALSNAIKKNFEIIHVKNYIGKVGTKHLDICGFYGTPHTMVFDSGKKTWDFGSRAGMSPKIKCHKVNSYGQKVGLILRLKEDQKKPEHTPTKKGYSGKFPVLPTGRRTWYQIGDTGTNVKYIQLLTNWAIGSKLVADGVYGQKTAEAIKKIQKKAGTKQNGKFGKNCLAYCKKLKK